MDQLPALIMALTALISAIGAVWVNIIKAKKMEATQRTLEEKLDDNTVITQQAKTEMSEAATSANKAAAKANETMEEVKTAVNGRMDELLNEARRKAYAEGFAVGQQQALKQMKGKT